MRLLLTLFVLLQIGLPFPGPGSPHSSATVTFVQSALGSNGNTSTLATANVTVTSGNLLIGSCNLWASSITTNPPTASDTLTSTWTLRGNTGLNTSNFNSRSWIFTAPAASSGTDAFTCTSGGGDAGHYDVAMLEYSGATTVDATAIDCNNNNSAATGVTHSVTTTVTDTLVATSFGAASGTVPLNTPSGFTSRATGSAASGNTFSIYDKSAVAAGAQTVIDNASSGTTPLHSCLLPIHP